jgi:hypothetical protein
MPFAPFHEYFPEIATRETRSITMPIGTPFGLPAGEYAFIELYCNDPGCDCRRVLFCVIARNGMSVQAFIGWGWEDIEFYRRWLHDGSQAEVIAVKGPALNVGSPCTAIGPALVELVRNVLLTDPAYVERIKRHYAMVRAQVDKPVE